MSNYQVKDNHIAAEYDVNGNVITQDEVNERVKSDIKWLKENGTALSPEQVESLAKIPTLSSQLDENVKSLNIDNQVDFVEEIKKISSVKSMNVKLGNFNNKAIFIYNKLSETYGSCYEFAKNTNDDYIIALGGYCGDLTNTESVIENKNGILTGTFDKTNAPNYYTTTVGSYISTFFIGTKITFYVFADNRGGLWEFTLDEGTGGEKKINISGYSATSGYKEITLFENLDLKKHTIKGVFKGADPNNAPTGGTARGWVYHGGTRPQDIFRTFNVYGDAFSVSKEVQALYSYSNKDFAFSIRKQGSSADFNFVPEHTGGSAFKVEEPKIIVDGKIIDDWFDGKYISCNTFQLVQVVNGYNLSNLSEPLIQIITYHTIKDGVMNVTGKMKVLEPIEMNVGYTMMMPYFANFITKIKTSTNNVYVPILNQPNYKQFWGEEDNVRSCILMNDVVTDYNKNVVTAITYDNKYETMRSNKDFKGQPFSWIEHRNSTMGKIYMQQFKDATLPVGYTYSFYGKFIVSYIQNATNMFL